MIRELSEFGKLLRNRKIEDGDIWIHNALNEEPISIEIVITENGCFEKFVLLDKRLTKAEMITAKKGKARLLLDKAEEVICCGGQASKKKYELFMNKLAAYEGLPELKPVIAFYKRADGREKALKEFETAIPKEKNRKGNIGFRVQNEGLRIHEKPEVLRTIKEKYDTAEHDFILKSPKNCSICGKGDYSVSKDPHGMIKNVPEGKTSGSAMVSYNSDAFESYGLRSNDNSSICTNCARTYVEGLNELLSSGTEVILRNEKGKDKKVFRYRNRRNFGSDTAMVFWTRRNKELPEIDQLEKPDPGEVARLFDSVASAKEGDSRYCDTEQFYSCTLSGAAARIMVRDWIETSMFDFGKAIAQWFKDIAVIRYDTESKKTKIHYSRLYSLASNCQRKTIDGKYDKEDKSFARVAAYLWNTALKKNTTPPLWMLARVIQRACINGVSAERAALIRLILNRHNRRKNGGDFMITEDVAKGKRPVAYISGQIFAKLESIQYAALGEVNANIFVRYFTWAMTSPLAAFGRLFNDHSKHYAKLMRDKPRLAVKREKELQALVNDIVDINSLPAIFSLEEKGQFAIGYYHQKQL